MAEKDVGSRRGQVLVVDDELMVATALRRTLARDHEVTMVQSAQVALGLLDAGQRFDAIVCDLLMPGMTGIQLFEELERRFPEQAERTVFVTASGSTPEGSEFLARVANPRLDKPWDVPTLRALVRRVVG
jgi:CheY-like chemotaxis protein